MHCPMEGREGAELLLDYCARRLDPEKSAWFDRHLAFCASCRELVAAQKQVWEALDYWNALPEPSDFDRKLEWRIEAEERRQWFRRNFAAGLAGWLRTALPAASLATAALAVFMIHAPDRPESGLQPWIEKADMEQAESALEDLDMIRQFTLPPRELGGGNRI